MLADFQGDKVIVTMSQEEFFQHFDTSKKTQIGSEPVPIFTSVSETDLIMEVTDILKRIGVPAHIKGYEYLREAIILSVNDQSYIQHITRKLYPELARRFNTMPSRAERAIRHAIEIACSNRGSIEELSNVLGYLDMSRGRPTNSEFIATIADTLRLRRK